MLFSYFPLQEEFHKTTFAYYLRTVDECKIPFTCRDSPVRRAGLSLVSIETKTVPCAYRQKWLKHGGDPKAHARWYVPAMKSWSNSTFLSGKTKTFLKNRFLKIEGLCLSCEMDVP